VSASAQLASALLAVGEELPLLAPLVAFVVGARRATGGWGDADGPDDVLTTLVAFELLLQIDPSFDPAPHDRVPGARNRETTAPGCCYGPEVPWLTVAVADALAVAALPFASRFRWPHLPAANRDHKTRLPFYAWFDLLARLFASLPSLAASETELGFIDLAGFRAFNNAHGQDAGDSVLAAFAGELARIEAAAAIRDGGDEFLVVARAGARRACAAISTPFAAPGPRRFRARFGDNVPPVAPRILVTKTRGRDLRTAREVLGRTIASLKDREKPGPEGLLVEV
jgi:GGDEF domain-containing protein